MKKYLDRGEKRIYQCSSYSSRVTFFFGNNRKDSDFKIILKKIHFFSFQALTNLQNGRTNITHGVENPRDFSSRESNLQKQIS